MVKIQDKEILEPPHVTIRRKAQRWRLDLRRRQLMDEDPPVRGVPVDLLVHLSFRWQELEAAWDRMYPSNPVSRGSDR